ncbi:hypothetical protein DV515_00018815 [Chloebia gouldiae]|uniref:Uncharacterized protein n=1 Tax=Chloebia gouldiae TaxID=44316 RepID=A0A3L8Q6H6_CHLGU|nr:hypothetical protein DV515_00018815 [Chloebia gouldiae]
MRNSPTLCQLYVDAALQPLRRKWPDTVIYHYMDDILFAQANSFSATQLQEIQSTLAMASLVVAQEKIQHTTPWKYLGWSITDQIVRPQKLQISTQLTNLHEAQRFLGDLQWLKPIVGLPNSLLDVLRPLLKGTDPSTPLTLTLEQKTAIQRIVSLIERGCVSRRDLSLPIDMTVWSTPNHLLGALTQCKQKTGEIRILEWMSPPLQARKTIQTKIENIALLLRKGRIRILEITGTEPASIYLPIRKEDLDWYLLNSEELQVALLGSGASVFTGPLVPRHLQWLKEWDWVAKPLRSEQPILGGLTAFTDAGKKSRKAAVTWKEGPKWKHKTLEATPTDTLQTLELFAVVWALSHLTEPLNVVTDSYYVAGVAQRIEDASIKEVQNKRLYELLTQLKRAVAARTAPYCILHIRSHKWDVGLGEGNARADRLVMNVSDDRIVAAQEAHAKYHQNAKGLARAHNIGIQDARTIVRTCPVCSHHNSGLGLGHGVNPRGLSSNEIWQMDVTHVAEFGKLRYVHVTVDTYSKYIWATAQAGEKALHVVRHMTSSFAVMGVPKEIKTDNGPSYTSKKVSQFMRMWGVRHVTGIPHSPTGQAIVERANSTLKQYLMKQRQVLDVQERLVKTLYVLNQLCVFGEDADPPVVKHFDQVRVKAVPDKKPWVNYKNPKTGFWEGPAEVVNWGRGYVCVSTPTGTLWIPAKWVKPALHDRATRAPDAGGPNENPSQAAAGSPTLFAGFGLLQP